MQSNPVVWFEIYVQDLPRAKAFYESMLGVKLDKLDSPAPDIEMFSFPMQQNGPGAAGALAKMKGVPSGGGGTMVYFTCEDCAVEAKRAASSGGKVIKDKFSIGQYGQIAMVQDPDGNMIGLHSMK